MRIEVETKQVTGVPWDTTVKHNLFWAHIYYRTEGASEEVKISGVMWSQSPVVAVTDACDEFARYIRETNGFKPIGWNLLDLAPAKGKYGYEHYRGLYVIKDKS